MTKHVMSWLPLLLLLLLSALSLSLSPHHHHCSYHTTRVCWRWGISLKIVDSLSRPTRLARLAISIRMWSLFLLLPLQMDWGRWQFVAVISFYFVVFLQTQVQPFLKLHSKAVSTTGKQSKTVLQLASHCLPAGPIAFSSKNSWTSNHLNHQQGNPQTIMKTPLSDTQLASTIEPASTGINQHQHCKISSLLKTILSINNLSYPRSHQPSAR